VMRTFRRLAPRDDCYDFNPESPNLIGPQERSNSGLLSLRDRDR